jgi:hypothetical protein
MHLCAVILGTMAVAVEAVLIAVTYPAEMSMIRRQAACS